MNARPLRGRKAATGLLRVTDGEIHRRSRGAAVARQRARAQGSHLVRGRHAAGGLPETRVRGGAVRRAAVDAADREGRAGRRQGVLGHGLAVDADVVDDQPSRLQCPRREEPDASDADWGLQALATEVHFDVESENAAIQPRKIHEVIASDKALDFTVVRIDEASDRSPLPVDSRTIDIKDGEIRPLNVIQHPNGKAKKIAIRNNLATAAIAPQVRYFTATYGGSSGLPVFSDDWHVVAIHCGSVAYQGAQLPGSADRHRESGNPRWPPSSRSCRWTS